MFCLIAYDKFAEMICYFLTDTDARPLMEERFRLERAGLEPGEEVVILAAPDLYTLTRTHSRYFASHECEHWTDSCFYCRSMLALNQINLDEVAALTSSAYWEGHCLLCHQFYPVADGRAEEHLRIHSRQCPVLFGHGNLRPTFL